MKVLIMFVAAVLSSCPVLLIAQRNQPGPAPAACGDLNVSMAVKLDDSQHTIAQPEAGKALIYFIQDTGLSGKLAYPTTKIGIDGKWTGANKKNSYFSVPLEPGEHHICAEIQSSFLLGYYVELAHLTAEAGHVYYFRTRIFYTQESAEYFTLMPADSDEARFLIASNPLATAHARK